MPVFCTMCMCLQGCVFTRDINKAILISDAMETGTVQINSAPARGPDHFPFQVIFIPRQTRREKSARVLKLLTLPIEAPMPKILIGR